MYGFFKRKGDGDCEFDCAVFQNAAPQLFFLASIPGAVSMLASALYQTIDGVLSGRFWETAFAALNLAMPFVIINFSLADLDRRRFRRPHIGLSGKEPTRRGK